MADKSVAATQPFAGTASQVPVHVCGPVCPSAVPNNFDPTGKYQLRFQGAFSAVEVAVTEEDGCKSDAGSMITMSANVDIDAKMEGGLGTGLLRCCCAGTSIFFNHYRLLPGLGPRGDILLAPAFPGELTMFHLDGRQAWSVQSGSFLCCDHTVDVGVRMLNVKQGLFGGEGLFVIEARGAGRLVVASYGSIARYDLQPGEKRKIDDGYMVCWSSDMRFTIGKASRGWLNTFRSGEGLVANFTGPGTVFVQTRSMRKLAECLRPYLPSGSAGGGGNGSD